MKLFGFEIRKFEKGATTIQMIETWCVKWQSLHIDILGKGSPRTEIQAFPTEGGAIEYSKELTDARKLLGDKGFDVVVYKQQTPTNAA